MIRVNLRDDWREFVEAEAPKLGLRYSATSTLEQNTIAFLNARRRSVPRRPRVVHESRPARHTSPPRVQERDGVLLQRGCRGVSQTQLRRLRLDELPPVVSEIHSDHWLRYETKVFLQAGSAT